MSTAAIVGIAFALAMDAFAVAVAVGARLEQLSFRPVFRLSFHFGLFQFFMPFIGWAVGIQVEPYVAGYDHWVAAGLLWLIGGKMIYESFSEKGREKQLADPTRKWSLVILSTATSIDALTVGLTISLLDVDILLPCVIIGLVAAGMTILGMMFGRKLSAYFGKTMEVAGGVILIAIGLNIVYELL
jgi:putative Mn2+ efflux pump MntP